MNTSSLSPKWTYADLISSYRFWSIVLFYLFFTITITAFNSFMVIYLSNNFAFSRQEIGEVMALRPTALCAGFVLAWAASRIKNYYPLYFFGALLALGVELFYLSDGKVELIFLGQILVGICQGAIFLLIPAYIAGAVKTVEVFVLSFGLCYILSWIIQALTTFAFGHIYSYGFSNYSEYESIILGSTIAIPVLIGCFFLLPIKRALFNEAPRERRSSTQAPDEVQPFFVFLLFFVPLYYIYWSVRIHRETWSLVKTQRLMTANGAGWSAFLVPFAVPIMCAVLNDVLRELLQQKNQSPGYKTGWIILFFCLFPPIGAAMIQTQINRLNRHNNVNAEISHESIVGDQSSNTT